ncbi:protoporphyrinogen oxidase HemJ [Rickettsiales endosymbiont of Stachyamoeba lipophora]|uniref:protoporphyrinogen oxidase HemJ n=1 Tax=Rickettsiales endosymbiont of Stachyamoeba lipophora TaxID=2486578 RepID=UPI000F64680A|nr:protoporphyrinogen oxidase HemJ [Rickettsiales endosymbiont of Stachyamoeba lipophora]AZL15607.1 protoporphyrinogen oxidase HemJ [Rickettsiales endosymbiont of Stachyamoeba lipophora]
MENYYLWFKALHIISIVAWMAGMFYLPRLFVYHTENQSNHQICKVFEVMERRLLKIIINPAMILTFIFGLSLMKIVGFENLGKWFHVKLLLILILTGFHGLLAKYRKDLLNKTFIKNAKFFRIINEIPTIIVILIIILAVVKPF